MELKNIYIYINEWEIESGERTKGGRPTNEAKLQTGNNSSTLQWQRSPKLILYTILNMYPRINWMSIFTDFVCDATDHKPFALG